MISQNGGHDPVCLKSQISANNKLTVSAASEELSVSEGPIRRGSAGQDEDRANSSSLASHQIGEKIAGDSVGGVFAFGDDAGHKRLGGLVPFEIDCARDIRVGAV